MTTTPNFAGTPRCGVAQITTANTNLDGTGTIGTIFTAGSSGSRIDAINIKATGNTTAGMIRLYIHDNSNARLIAEIPVIANTASSTNPAFEFNESAAVSNLFPLVLPVNYSLRASTHVAETFNVVAFGGDF